MQNPSLGRKSAAKSVCLLAIATFTGLSCAQIQAPKTNSAPIEPHKYGVLWKLEYKEFQLLRTNYQQWTRPLLSQDGQRIYIATNDGRLESRRVESGDLLWKLKNLGDFGASLAEYQDTLIAGINSDLVGFDANTGKEKWRLVLGGRIAAKPLIQGSIAVFPIRPNSFAAFNLDSQQRIWQVKQPTPQELTIRGQAIPGLSNNKKIVYLGFSSGELKALDIATGQEVWTRSTIGERGQNFADVDTQPLLANNGRSLIVAGYNSSLYSLNALDGSVEWKQPFDKITSLVTAKDLIVAARGDKGLIGIRPSGGEVAWTYRMKKSSPNRPVYLDPDLVAVTSLDGPLHILDAATGKPLQTINPGSGSSVPPEARSANLVMFSNQGTLLMLRKNHPHGVLINQAK